MKKFFIRLLFIVLLILSVYTLFFVLAILDLSSSNCVCEKLINRGCFVLVEFFNEYSLNSSIKSKSAKYKLL